MKTKQKITIPGGGNLGISEGLLKSRSFNAGNIMITRRRIELLRDLKDKRVVTSF